MNLDTFSFFLIILGGFGLVYAYRAVNSSKDKLAEFEYLCFSAVFGVPVYMIIESSLLSTPEVLGRMVSDQYAAYAGGLYIFALGLILGAGAALIKRAIFSLWQRKP